MEDFPNVEFLKYMLQIEINNGIIYAFQSLMFYEVKTAYKFDGSKIINFLPLSLPLAKHWKR